jgi:PAS domain S-box-containing protein
MLVNASIALSASIDYSATLRNIARVAVDLLADWCLILVISREGKVVRGAVEFADPKNAPLAQKLGTFPPPSSVRGSALKRAMQTRQSQLVPDFDGLFDDEARASEYVQLLRASGVHSAMAVPLVARGTLLGAIALIASSPRPPYLPSDLLLAEDLSRFAAIAIDNARLYQAEREARAEAEQALKAREQSASQLQAIIDQTSAIIYLKNLEGRFLLGNRPWRNLFGEREAPIGLTAHDVFPVEVADKFRAADLEAIASRGTVQREELLPLSDGVHTFITLRFPIFDGSGELIGTCGMATDITAQKAAELEQQHVEGELRQSQKMEAIGRLAGGVAHDFNNILTAIGGYGALVIHGLPADSPLRPSAEQIVRSVRRAAGITEKLLAVSRKQVSAPAPLSLNGIVAEMHPMLARMVGESYPLKMALEPGLGAARVDGGQIEQVLLNLVVNARDAMADGGPITIATRNVDVLAGSDGARRIPPGCYVVLSVSDVGRGIDAGVQEHLFEPFFTTKKNGTGLGLSIVYGIVKQSQGHIAVESRPGKGSELQIYLPRIAEAPIESRQKTPVAVVGVRHETVLVAEDDTDVRELTLSVLTRAGYRVIIAVDGEDALAKASRHRGEIHLLLSDVVMPGMTGLELAEEMRRSRPALRVVFMSGYAGDALGTDRWNATTPLLLKPFAIRELESIVRGALDDAEE